VKIRCRGWIIYVEYYIHAVNLRKSSKRKTAADDDELDSQNEAEESVCLIYATTISKRETKRDVMSSSTYSF
jgi:hypothetical protein